MKNWRQSIGNSFEMFFLEREAEKWSDSWKGMKNLVKSFLKMGDTIARLCVCVTPTDGNDPVERREGGAASIFLPPH